MDEILDEKTYETRKVSYASFSLRTIAFLIDIFIFVAISYGLFYMFRFAPTYLMFLKLFWWKIIVIIAVYFIYFDGSESNATLGKQIMNIRLLNEQQRSVNFTDSAKHFFFSILLFFGYFVLLSNDKPQTMADKICKVIVVNVN